MRHTTRVISIIIVAAASVATALPLGHQAFARDGMNGALIGGAAAGVLGGVAVGALLNGAQAAPPPVYRAPPPRPVYVEPETTETVIVRPRGPVCHMERRKVWLDSEEYTYRRVEVCE